MRKKSGKEPKEKLYILLYREKPNSINYVVRLQIHLGLQYSIMFMFMYKYIQYIADILHTHCQTIKIIHHLQTNKVLLSVTSDFSLTLAITERSLFSFCCAKAIPRHTFMAYLLGEIEYICNQGIWLRLEVCIGMPQKVFIFLWARVSSSLT